MDKEQIIDFINNRYDDAKLFFETDKYRQHYADVRAGYKYLCIFGAGVLGTTVCRWLTERGIIVDFFVDNNKKKVGEKKNNIQIISFSELEKLGKENVYIIVSTTNKGYNLKYNDEINKSLETFPHVERNICRFMAYYTNDYLLSKELCIESAVKLYEKMTDDLSKQLFYDELDYKFVNTVECTKGFPIEKYYDPLQYFTPSIYCNRKDDVIVDCGAFEGDTLKSFLDNHYEFLRYHCFEMDKNALRVLYEYTSGLDKQVRDKIVIHDKGVYSQKKDARCSLGTDTLSTRLDEFGEEIVNLVSLDEELMDEKVSMINMDIEGAELDALVGADSIIHSNKPTLAISVYHSTEQFFSIPLYLIDRYPFYSFALRAHTTITDDTILYAIPREE